ncbi:MAG: hypothetical protein R3A79_25770, partial [Nannocystaceae bacterium]
MTLASALKDRVKELSGRADVRVTYSRLGRPIKKAWLLEYARDEHGLPPAIVDFYAALDGLQFAWRGNGLTCDPRDAGRGFFCLRKLDDLMWFDKSGFEVMRLESDWGDQGLLLVREGGALRVVYAAQAVRDDLRGVIELGSFEAMIEAAIARAFLPPPLIDSPAALAVIAALAAPAPKRKIAAGARVFAAKVKTEGFGVDRRGAVTELVKGANGKPYALIDWDHGDRSFTRATHLVGLGEDLYERARERPLGELTPEEAEGLLDQFGHDTSVALYRDADEDRPVRLSCEATLWLAAVSRATPLPAYLDWVRARLDAIDGLPDQAQLDAELADGVYVDARVDIPLTGRFGGDHLGLFATSRDTRRRAQVLVESAALRWIRDPEGVARADILAILERGAWEPSDEETLVAAVRGAAEVGRLAPVPEYDSATAKAAALGLKGAPVYYT